MAVSWIVIFVGIVALAMTGIALAVLVFAFSQSDRPESKTIK